MSRSKNYQSGTNGSRLGSRSRSRLNLKRNNHTRNGSKTNLSKNKNQYAENFFSDKKNRDWLKKMGKRR